MFKVDGLVFWYGNTTANGNAVIRNVAFSPKVSLVGDGLAVNEFSFEMSDELSYTLTPLTGDYEILLGGTCNLRDERGAWYARFFVSSARLDTDGYWRITARSPLGVLNNEAYSGQYRDARCFYSSYSHTIVGLELRQIFMHMPSTPVISDRFDEPLFGYRDAITSVPEYLNMLAQAYGIVAVDSTRAGYVDLRSIDEILSDDPIVIPEDHVYWRPRLAQAEVYEYIDIEYYNFVDVTDTGLERTDEYVEADVIDGTVTIVGKVYTVLKRVSHLRLRNPNADTVGRYHPSQTVTVSGNTFITGKNVRDVANRLARYYFDPMKVTFDCIYEPRFVPGSGGSDWGLGRKLAVKMEDGRMVSGIVEAMSFTNGRRLKATITLAMCEEMENADVRVTYKWGSRTITTKDYTLPVGTGYELEVPCVEADLNGHRYVFKPTTSSIEGTVSPSGNSHTVQCEVALDYYKGELFINEVDDVSESEGTVSIS